jgi:phosphoglycerate dehydrogenase-like enzyme
LSNLFNRSRFVLITAPLAEGWIERLRNISPDLQIEWVPNGTGSAISVDLWQSAEILYTSFVTRLPAPEMAPNLRWVQLYSAGADRITDTRLYRSPVIFTSASGVHAINIAEQVFSMTLAWMRHVPLIVDQQRQHRWPPNAGERVSMYMAEELWGKTIGIVGYGSIGRQVAALARAFGMRVLAMQRGDDHRDRGFQFPGVGDPEGLLPECYYAPEQLHVMLRECDVVVIALPLTTRTRGLFDAAAFQSMRPTTFLVNIARGEICDETDLLYALETKQIGGAALDVFHEEPLPPQHPFWQLPNVFITPHSAGLTPRYNERAAMIFEENLRCYLAGQPLYNVVDKTRGY